jgi:lactate dehydrogenase-like 2-hydroxyacid dehydrogenase
VLARATRSVGESAFLRWHAQLAKMSSRRRHERRCKRMRFSTLGTGMVGKTIAARLAGLGHDVMVGTRETQVTLSRTEPD